MNESIKNRLLALMLDEGEVKDTNKALKNKEKARTKKPKSYNPDDPNDAPELTPEKKARLGKLRTKRSKFNTKRTKNKPADSFPIGQGRLASRGRTGKPSISGDLPHKNRINPKKAKEAVTRFTAGPKGKLPK